MIVVEKNHGQKIRYSVEGNEINFGGEITLDLSKYERDFPVHLDICRDKFGFLTMGLSERYVAQIDIPERHYNMEENGTDEEGNLVVKPVSVAFDMNTITLILWEVVNNA